MLATEKIAGGFAAIVGEAEKMIKMKPAEDILSGLKNIVSIAKHQSDIRTARSGQCQSHTACR